MRKLALDPYPERYFSASKRMRGDLSLVDNSEDRIHNGGLTLPCLIDTTICNSTRPCIEIKVSVFLFKKEHFVLCCFMGLILYLFDACCLICCHTYELC